MDKPLTIDSAARKIWDYMLMHQPLKKADVIFVLGNRDTRCAEHAANLYKQGLAPVVLFAGSGSIHNHKIGREQFIGTTEAEVFAAVARENGVPESAIIIENTSQNTGQNYEFSIKKLAERGIKPKTMILVQKPFMERRTYATGKIWLPDVELIATSPPCTYETYIGETTTEKWLINGMIGDMQRIREYPAKGFQIPQDIPTDV